MDPDPLPAIICFILAIITFGIAVAAEISLAAVNRSQIRQMGENAQTPRQKRRALTVDQLLDNAPRLLTTMMLVRNLTMLVATGTLVYLLTTPLANFAILIPAVIILWLFFVVYRVVVRTFSNRSSTTIALRLAPIVNAVVLMLRPLSTFLRKLELSISGESEDAVKESVFLTEDGLRLLIDVGDEEDHIEESEKQMIASILDLDDTVVREVMVPRIDMIAMSHDTSLTDALDIIINAGHSRIPVYEESVDRIIGVLYAKDLLKYFRNAQHDVAIRDVLRRAYFVPASKKVDVLFKEMQQQRFHIALIVDEYGGTSGLVTIEDLLEQIVGEIQDEYDSDVELLSEQIGPDTYSLGSRISVDELEKLLGINADHLDVDTLGGLLYMLFERVPEQGETVDFGNWRFMVLSVDGHRIQRVRVEPLGNQAMLLNEGETMTVPTREPMMNT